MGRPLKSTKASLGKGSASHPTKKAVNAPPTAPTRSPPGEPLLQHKYQALIRKHLSKLLDTLYAEFTGVHFQIAWTPASPRHWEARTLPTGCSVCCRHAGSALLPECRICGPRQLVRTLSTDGRGHHFTCPLGICNYWVPIRVHDTLVGIAYLQGLETSGAKPRAGKPFMRAAQARLRRAGARVMSRLESDRAARLLQLVVQHVQTASLADLREQDLTKAQRALRVLENVQARLLKKHNAVAPTLRQPFPLPQPESHCEQIVHAVLERIQRDYAQAITLRDCASELRISAAYLSHLFSLAVGLPFKTYLTEVRVEKARELLGDPARTVSEVASAVGYASENRFRIAFKKASGLSPRMWRETMRMNPPLPACSA
jgi:AraC-like DNA-binding protein